MDLTIRPAVEKDVDAIYGLICELEEKQFPKDAFSVLYKNNLAVNTIAYLVAVLGEKVVGFGSIYVNTLLHHCGRVAEIQELIVSATARKKNIGRALLTSLIEWAKLQDVVQVEVTSNIKRTDALAFYQANGFTHTHQKMVYEHLNAS